MIDDPESPLSTSGVTHWQEYAARLFSELTTLKVVAKQKDEEIERLRGLVGELQSSNSGLFDEACHQYRARMATEHPPGLV